MRSTSILNSLGWFLTFKHFGGGIKLLYMSLWINIHILLWIFKDIVGFTLEGFVLICWLKYLTFQVLYIFGKPTSCSIIFSHHWVSTLYQFFFYIYIFFSHMSWSNVINKSNYVQVGPNTHTNPHQKGAVQTAARPFFILMKQFRNLQNSLTSWFV